MTSKQYKFIKIAIAFVLAMIFSQAIIYKNYLIPIIAVVAGYALLITLRGKVKDVIADERDYLIGGKSALLTIQIYSWITVIAMFILYAFRDINPTYEPIGSVLAYSTCLLMLMYSLIFRFYNKIELLSKKFIYIALGGLVLIIVLVIGVRLISGEDNWICQNGKWIKHGNPSFPAPTVLCK